MFNDLTKEILYYSLIPFLVIAFIAFILIIIGKKKYNNYYKYNYVIKTMLFVIIALVLPLITGYTIWIYEKYISRGVYNILYMILLGVLVISLLVLLFVSSIKLYKGLSYNEINDENKRVC